MTRLMQTLFVHAQENLLMRYLSHDRCYRSAQRHADARREALHTALSPEHAAWLDDLLYEEAVIHSIEQEAAFLAGFHIAMELARQP